MPVIGRALLLSVGLADGAAQFLLGFEVGSDTQPESERGYN